MTELYINKKKVDLSDEISILLSKSRSDYLNPTAVKNSFSKTVTLPGTNSNNALFNEIWQLDRTQWTGAFNPSKRVDFDLVTNGTLDEMGYVKLNKISKSNGSYVYDVTLFGELGNILYTLSYNVEEDTQEVRDLTLGDLIYEQELTFHINKNMVLNGWNTLAGTDTTNPIYQTLNFAPAYNGKPKANKFDAKKVWVNEYDEYESSTMWGSGRTVWDGQGYTGFPRTKTIDGVEYKLLNTMISRMDPTENYGLLELPDAVTDLEVRDFRSYLLRPILRLSKIFEAIDRYIYEKKGWHLVLNDSFFLRDDYANAWVTLNMLYEIDPDVETGTYFTQAQFLSKTAAPYKYLVSFCKMYGLYLDVDVTTKTLALRSMKNFFLDKTEDLIVNEGSEISIDPLSFDKSSYTFDFGESKDADFIKTYNETHEVPYGSKKVNTGYAFDLSSDKYIKDNIFKNATDAIEQSPYYKFSLNYPAALYDNDSAYLQAKEIKFTLFANGQASDTESIRHTATITRNNMGLYYVAPRYTWGGLQAGVYQDDYPKVQLHNDKNEAIDGSNVIVYFRGMTTANVAQPNYDYSSQRLFWTTNSSVNPNTYWNVTDDSWTLKQAIGKNCWINNIQPGFGYGSTSPATVVKSIPNFTREDYTFGDTATFLFDRNFQQLSIQDVNGCQTSVATNFYLQSKNNNGLGGDYPVYFYHPQYLMEGHKYLILASVNMNSGRAYNLYTKYAGADDVPGELIAHMDLQDIEGRYQVTGSIMKALTSSNHNLYPFKMCSPNKQTFTMYTRWFAVYDLTMLGLADRINTVEEGIAVMGVPTEERSFMGSPYRMTTSHDFSTPTEIYVPNTFAMLGRDIYNLYWRDYIADIYSINTRVLTAEIYLADIHDSFKKFYWYNNALWCLSSISDWNPETKICKAKLLKINDKGNYTNYLEIVPSVFNAPLEGTELTLTFIKKGSSTGIMWDSNNEWIHNQNGDRTGSFYDDTYTFVIDANENGSKREGSITFTWNGRNYIYNITQDGLFEANVVVIGGTCEYTLSASTFSAGETLWLEVTPNEHEHVVNIYANKEWISGEFDETTRVGYTTKDENVTFYITMDHDPVYDIDIDIEDPDDGDVTIEGPDGEPIVGPVFEGEDIYIRFNPKPHYHVSVFTVDGVDHLNDIVDNLYIIRNVTSRPNIVVDYAEDPMFNITSINMSPELGSISVISTEGRKDRVYLHEDVVIMFSTTGRNVIGTFTINGVNHLSGISANRYIIRDVDEDKNIIVDFHPDGVYLEIIAYQDDADIIIERL